MTALRCRAAWVLPIDRAPIANGAVLVAPDGRITAVGADAEVPAPPGAGVLEFPSSALLPGLVNTHTHLELTGLDGRVTEQDFPSWIRKVIALKAERSPADFFAAAKQGIRDGWRQGVTTVADTGDSGATLHALHELGGNGIAYQEVFGPHPDQAPAQAAGLVARLDALAPLAGGRVRLGVSPHAPYSVSGPLYTLVARLARERGYPIAVHIAESLAESDLLGTASGGFAEAWKGRGIPLPSLPGRTPLDWLEEHGILGPATLCIHVVQASNRDLALLASRGAAVAHCPRSNARHGHGAAPLRSMLDLGIRVGIGTDSVASVAPCDLLAEGRAASALARLQSEDVLRLCTLEGARALGLGNEVGSLTPGKWGDLVAFRLPGPVDGARLADTLVTRRSDGVLATFLAGRQVWRSSS
ncbi:MAG TPA: amidohydrolase family protein [Gemmatimonadales bacterium]|jgi:5-methylthioadenosine/S-adenosylhomocysteine deaminase